MTKTFWRDPDRASRDAIRINRSVEPKDELPLIVRELADLLAELAAMQFDADLHDSEKEQ